MYRLGVDSWPMTLHTWIEAGSGRAQWMAKKFDITRAAVYSWRTSGVPMQRMLAIQDLTAGEVTVKELIEHAMQCRMEKLGVTQ